jgi:hypothetical protein
MTRRATATHTLLGACFVLALSSKGVWSQAVLTPAPPPNACAGLKLPAGTLEQALSELGRKQGFEVSIAKPAIAQLAVKEEPLTGASCVAAITQALDDLNLSFAVGEGPGRSILKVVVVDFKSTVSTQATPQVPALPDTESFTSDIVEEPAASETESEPRKDKEPPTDDELIDMGDGMKLYKVPPVYVPMTPGLVPPNAVVAGPEVLAESHHGAETASENAVVTPTTTPAPAPANGGKAPFPGSPLPPNVPNPKPTP